MFHGLAKLSLYYGFKGYPITHSLYLEKQFIVHCIHSKCLGSYTPPFCFCAGPWRHVNKLFETFIKFFIIWNCYGCPCRDTFSIEKSLSMNQLFKILEKTLTAHQVSPFKVPWSKVINHLNDSGVFGIIKMWSKHVSLRCHKQMHNIIIACTKCGVMSAGPNMTVIWYRSFKAKLLNFSVFGWN